MAPKSEKHNSLNKNNDLSLDHNDINYDVGRFSFVLSQEIEDLERFRNNYILDWSEIIAEYLEVGIGDVPHFASQYVFAKALHADRTSERAEMQAMYLEIVSHVNKLIEKGDLPAAI